MIKGIIFDVDGVIIDTEKIHYQAFKEVLKKYNYQLNFISYKKYFSGKSIKGGLLSLLVDTHIIDDIDDDFIKNFSEQKINQTTAIFKKNLIFFEDTIKFIKEIKSGKQNILHLDTINAKPKMAIVTGLEKVLLNEVVKHHNLSKIFSVFVTSENYTHSKPHPECYNKAVTMMKIAPEKCLGIEDSPSGIKALNSANIHSVGITSTHNQQELAEAEVITSSLMSLIV